MALKFIIQDDGLVNVDNEMLVSFSEFEKIILKDIPSEKIEYIGVRYNHYCINYDKSGSPSWIEIYFSNPNVIKNYKINFNINEVSRKFHTTLALLYVKTGEIDELDEEQKLICLNYLKENMPKFSSKILLKNIGFLLSFLVTIGGILFILPPVLWVKILFSFLVSLQFIVVKKIIGVKIVECIEMYEKRKSYKHKIEYLSKELDGSQKTIERKCEQQVQDFTKQQENILNNSYNFNNRTLEDVHNLLGKISVLNQEARNTLLLRVETLLSDYEKRVKDIEKNKDTVFYPDDYYKLKQDVYEEISKIELEIEKISKGEETEKKMTKDLGQLRSEIEILQNKEAKSLIENATLNDVSYKEIDKYNGDNIVFNNVQYDLTSAYDRKKLLEVLSKSGCIVGNIENQDVDADFLKMILSLANSEVFKFDVSNQFSESKVLKNLLSDFSDDDEEVKTYTRTKKFINKKQIRKL